MGDIGIADQRCDQAGKRPSEQHDRVNEARAKAIGREVSELRTNGVAGTPDEVLERLGALGAAGATRVYLQVLDLHDLDHLRLISERVLPHLA